MRTAIAFIFLIVVLSVPLWALPQPFASEIDAGSAASAIGLICGAVMLIRSRKKK
jgi:hypothetical protein